MELKRQPSRGSIGASPVCVVGTGAVTAVGVNAPMTAASVRANLNRFHESYLIDKAGEPMLLAVASFIDERLRGPERLLALGVPAAKEAVALLKQRVARYKQPRLRVLLGIAAPRPGWDVKNERGILERLEAEMEVPFSKTDRFVIPTGHAAGLLGIEHAAAMITSGNAEFVLVGGVDSYYDPETLEWLDSCKRLHSEENKDGFVPGEGAGFCLLSSVAAARRYELLPLAIVRSAVSGVEPHPFTSEGICIAEGLTRTLHRALRVLGHDERADWTLCDMNGESYRGIEWLYSYLRTGSKHCDPLEIWHPVDCYGDIGAASGLVLAGIAVAAWQRGSARGPRCLIWTSSDGPQRSAALLQLAHP